MSVDAYQLSLFADTQPSRKSDKGYVYFFQLGVLIKIGCTQNLQGRQRNYRTHGAKGIWLFAIRSDKHRQLERNFHEQFREYRDHDEWFALKTWHLFMLLDLYRADIELLDFEFLRFIENCKYLSRLFFLMFHSSLIASRLGGLEIYEEMHDTYISKPISLYRQWERLANEYRSRVRQALKDRK